MTTKHRIKTEADVVVRDCLDTQRSFALIAGAGAGKTSSLVDALEYVREQRGQRLRQNGQRVACITYTKRAVRVIETRLGFDSLFSVSTLHSFLWNQFSHFNSDIRRVLREQWLPELIERVRAKDDGGSSRTAIAARARAGQLESDIETLESVPAFSYTDAIVGDYPNGTLSHDDVIGVASHLLRSNETFRRLIGLRYPYIFVDEAQDTFEAILEGLNLIGTGEGMPVIGYFGDPWQQIYDHGVGGFLPPGTGEVISKQENFRCSESVIRLLNQFRDDLEQYAAGENRGREGSVEFRLVKAEAPEGPRRTYSPEQLERALQRMDSVIDDWGWSNRTDVTTLFLVHQMIARRMGFYGLNRLFNGPFASARAKEQFESGEYFLLRPLINTILPLVEGFETGDYRRIIDVLRRDSPAFSVVGDNATTKLKTMIDASKLLVEDLKDIWRTGTIGDVLHFSLKNKVVRAADSLRDQVEREARAEAYDKEVHSLEKGDWLADELFAMTTNELLPYAKFLDENSAFSTQHGVKGEEYSKVIVIYDDIEANWNHYNFGKLLTPGTVGKPTDGQLSRGRNLAYVSFSRATEDLRVLFFSQEPDAARRELIDKGLLEPHQIVVEP